MAIYRCLNIFLKPGIFAKKNSQTLNQLKISLLASQKKSPHDSRQNNFLYGNIIS